MDKKHENIDALFRDKLAGHRESPSPLAWEKLNVRLSEKGKGKDFWLKIAASFLLLMGITSLLWFILTPTDGKRNNLSQKEIIPETIIEENWEVEPIQEELLALDKEVRPSISNELTPPSKATASASPVMAEKKEAEKLITDKSGSSMDRPLLVEVEDIEMPPLDTDLLIAEKGLVEQEIVEVPYTVKIISNGISEQPEKETLVEDIEGKIDRIGGLLNKVDQGFAEIQDAKNNLFASIISKKQ
jgi:hypothetical protein